MQCRKNGAAVFLIEAILDHPSRASERSSEQRHPSAIRRRMSRSNRSGRNGKENFDNEFDDIREDLDEGGDPHF